MENRDLISLLDERVTSLMKKYNELQNENENLKIELSNRDELINQKNMEISSLQEDLAIKDLELEEIVGKISSILGN